MTNFVRSVIEDKWMPKKSIELKADNANKIQPAITAWEKLSKGETVSDEFILRAIKALDKANQGLKRKQLKTIRRKLFLLLPEKTRSRLQP